MATTTFGQILEFNEKLKDWIQYSKQLEHFFTANDIGDTEQSESPHCHWTKGAQAT